MVAAGLPRKSLVNNPAVDAMVSVVLNAP
jgi:hypothetical protein